MPASMLMSRLRAPSRPVMRVLAIAALVSQIGVALGGAVVRVSESGLGCPTWPQCAAGSLAPIAHPALGQVHQWIEFGNRLLGVGVGVIGALVFLAALLCRPRRRRVVLLALAMPLGVVVQAVIGGLTVLVKLDWWAVSLHFLPSPVLVWLAVLLVRAVSEGDEPVRPLVPRPLRGLLAAMTVVLAGLITAGTLVTAAGPHAGDARTPRLNLPVAGLAQLHADFLFVFLGMLIAVGFTTRITGGTREIWRAYWLLVATVLAQGALGMIQYWMGVPDLMVIFHVLGSILVTAAMAGLYCATRDRGAPPVPARTDGDYVGGAGLRSQTAGSSLANQP